MEENNKKKRELVDAAEQYDCQAQDGIFPMSGFDVEIISILSTILDKTEERELKSLIKTWKIYPDKWVLDKFRELAENWQERVSRYFITLGEFTFNVAYIREIQRFDKYSTSKMRQVYCIVINRSEIDKIPYANRMIEYLTPEDRDKAHEDFENKLKEFVHIKFL